MNRACANCGEEAPLNYCPRCGQKSEIALPSIGDLVLETLGAVFSYDNKLWRSIRRLIASPGGLTTDYLEGRRQSYIAPIQLFIWLQALTFVARKVWFDPQNRDSDAISIAVFAIGASFWLALCIFYYQRRDNVVKHLITATHICTFMMVLLLVLYTALPLMNDLLVRLNWVSEPLMIGRITTIATALITSGYSAAAIRKVYGVNLGFAMLQAVLAMIGGYAAFAATLKATLR